MPLSFQTDGRLRATVEFEDDAGVWSPITNAVVTGEIVDVAGAIAIDNLVLDWVAAANAYLSAILYNAGLKKDRTYRAIVDADGGPGKHWHGELEFTVEVDS